MLQLLLNHCVSVITLTLGGGFGRLNLANSFSKPGP